MQSISNLRQHIATDSLYRNSIYLMGSTFVVAIFGFLYWALAAHLYTTQAVGLAATLVAISNVVMILSVLGYDNSFIRFLPGAKNRDEQLNTGFTLSILAAMATSLIYLAAVHLFVPKLNFVTGSVEWIIFFVFFMVVNMLNFLNNYPFIAERATHVVLIINTGMGIFRLGLLFAFAQWGLNGLLWSQVLALFLAMLTTFYAMHRKFRYTFRPMIKWADVKRTWRYTFNSYLSIVFLTLPTYILPTLVVGNLGSGPAAYYYIVAVIIAALTVIPQATSQSLFAEGVWNKEDLNRQIRNASKIIFLLTLPAVVVLVLGGKIILGIFGSGYREGYVLLVLLTVSILPKALSFMLSTVLRIEHRVGVVAGIYGIYAAIILVGSFAGLKHHMGLAAIGWATLVAEIVAALLYIFVYKGSSGPTAMKLTYSSNESVLKGLDQL